MKRICRLGAGVLALLTCVVLAVAEGPDDLFVRVYNLLQQADTLQAGGQKQEAQTKYLEARSLLEQLQTSYPNWNEKIVNYRKNYIAERLGPNPPAAPKPAVPAAPARPAPKPEPEPKPEDGATALAAEIQSLRAERDNLQAKLREALAVQPAAVDPRELSKAERRLEELRVENRELKASVAQQQEKLARAVDPAAYAEAQKALKEANEVVKRQTQTVAALGKERDSLEQQLKRAKDKTQAQTARAEQRTAKRDQPATATPAPDELKAKADDLAARLKQAQDALAAERTRSEVLQAEKQTLEKRVAELAGSKSTSAPAVTSTPVAAPPAAAPSAAVAAAPTPPAATNTAAASPAPAPAPKQSKADKATEKAMMKQLERERDELRKRVNALTRELEDRRLRGGTGQNDRLAEELSILRARIQVYEARQVPYTPEELAQFKQTAGTTARSETVTPKKSARQVPAGAASLVAEARRAFQGRRLDEAERKFSQALALDEKNVGLLTDLAATHLEQNRLDAAETVLQRATAQDPNDPDVLSLTGLLRFRQGKYDEAMAILSRAVQFNPDNALTQNYLGVTLSQKGQRGPAETAFRKAIQIEPNYAEAHYNLAIVYAHQKPPFLELSRWHYQKAVAGGQPKNPEIETLLSAGAPAEPGK